MRERHHECAWCERERKKGRKKEREKVRHCLCVCEYCVCSRVGVDEPARVSGVYLFPRITPITEVSAYSRGDSQSLPLRSVSIHSSLFGSPVRRQPWLSPSYSFLVQCLPPTGNRWVSDSPLIIFRKLGVELGQLIWELIIELH